MSKTPRHESESKRGNSANRFCGGEGEGRGRADLELLFACLRKKTAKTRQRNAKRPLGG